MEDVMRRKGWSAEKWAREARTSPTNITRVSKQHYVPNSYTLAMLGMAAGEPPPLLPDSRLKLTRQLPIYGAGELRAVTEGDRKLAAPRDNGRRSMTLVSIDAPSHWVGAIVTTDSMNAAGIQIGDELVVDLLAPPAHGQIVACTRLNFNDVSPMVYAPPYLIPQSTNPEWKPVNRSDWLIFGVCKQVHRALP